MEKRSWSKEADYRRKNKKWLKYSSNIARRILSAIEDKKDFNQARLAEALGVTPQHISKIVQGKENLTLETIANLCTVLDSELITFPAYKDSYTQLDLHFVNQFDNYNLKRVDFKFNINNVVLQTTSEKKQTDYTKVTVEHLQLRRA